jgi:hypothetical protein
MAESDVCLLLPSLFWLTPNFQDPYSYTFMTPLATPVSVVGEVAPSTWL